MTTAASWRSKRSAARSRSWRTAPEIEARIVEFSLEQPAFGQIRAATAESYESRGVA
jgi:hypothetical protein